jgi:hypothetical protein
MRSAHCAPDSHSIPVLFHITVANLIIDLSQFIFSLCEPFRLISEQHWGNNRAMDGNGYFACYFEML